MLIEEAMRSLCTENHLMHRFVWYILVQLLTVMEDCTGRGLSGGGLSFTESDHHLGRDALFTPTRLAEGVIPLDVAAFGETDIHLGMDGIQ
jgi:hypothetical protein